jgi:membrane-associated phospholipid phosphatase
MNIAKYFELEKNPKRGLFALEWTIMAYMCFTLVLVLFCFTKVDNPDAMIWGRVRIVVVGLAMWVVYRLVPCRMTRMLRLFIQMSMLSWWYTDTYSLNILFPNLDHHFAAFEQQLFGFQPAMVFAERFSSPFVSELLDMAYISYFPIFAAVAIYYFLCRYKEFERCCFIIMASFLSFYVIYDVLPVVGPMYYYKAVGLDQIARGVFPPVGDYFRYHTEMLTSPGYKDGVFYQILKGMHETGEKPTAAFPSSHVGISVIALLLAWRTGNRTLFYILLPFAILICFATVYIKAHYVIDVFAGLVVGLVFYVFWSAMAKRFKV